MAYSSWSVVANEQPSASKWNILGTNDAYFDSLVGSGTAWTAYTPTFTNVTLGNGTVSGAYQQLGKTVNARFNLILGTTSSVTGSVTVSLPVAAATLAGSYRVVGYGVADDNGAGTYPVTWTWKSTTTIEGFVANSSTDTRVIVVQAGKPGTWNTSDLLTGNLTYEAA